MFSLTCGIVKETLKKKKKPTDTENVLVVARGEGRQGKGAAKAVPVGRRGMGEGDQRYKPPFVTNWDVLI